MQREIIKLEGIEKTFGSVTALSDINLSVAQGEFLALLGPSGCGKTTLLRMIAGFLEPSAGQLFISGNAMNDVPPNRRPVNTVFQNYALFPHMSVSDNIAFGLRRKRLPVAEISTRVTNALDTVGMQDYGARMPNALSGGQQQRVALARAIVNRPDVLLLDEPMAALDLKLRKRMQIELKRLHEKLGITFVLVTHDQEEALTIADRIAVMDRGNIVQIGTGQDIYNTPQSRFVADFIGEANIIPLAGTDSGVSNRDLQLPEKILVPGDRKANYLAVRPENIEVLNDLRQDWITTRGTLRQKVFLGSHWRLYLELPSGGELAIECTGETADRILLDAEVKAGWRPSQCRFLQN